MASGGRGRGRGMLRNHTSSSMSLVAPAGLQAHAGDHPKLWTCEDFDMWLKSVISAYRDLTSEQQVRAVSGLMSETSVSVRDEVWAALTGSAHPSTPPHNQPAASLDQAVREAAVNAAMDAVDLQIGLRNLHLNPSTDSSLAALPIEVSCRLLTYLSDADLCACRRVCKLWKGLIDVKSGVWEKRCDRLGIVPDYDPTPEQSALDDDEYEIVCERWRQAYADLSQQVRALWHATGKPRGSAAYRLSAIRDYHMPVDNVVQSCSIHLDHGFLVFAHGSGEGKVHSIATRRERIIHPGTESADFRLYDNRTVMYYSSNRSVQFERFESLANPKERADAEVTSVLKLRRMATAVDCCAQLDLVVVGYESGWIELWSVSKCKRWCVYAEQHKHPIYTLIIAALSPMITKRSDMFRLISYDPHRILVWEIGAEVKQPLYHLEANSEGSAAAGLDGGGEEDWDAEMGREHFAYGVVYKNGCLFHLTTAAAPDYSCWLLVTDIFTANTFHRVHLHDVGGASMLRHFGQSTDYRVFCLKDVGRRFALLVVKQRGFYYVMLLDVKTMECKKLDGMKRCCVEFQGRARGRGTYCGVEKALAPLLAAGDSKWLDGFNHANVKGVLYAYANHGTLPLVCEYQHECNEIVLVKWNMNFKGCSRATSDNRGGEPTGGGKSAVNQVAVDECPPGS